MEIIAWNTIKKNEKNKFKKHRVHRMTAVGLITRKPSLKKKTFYRGTTPTAWELMNLYYGSPKLGPKQAQSWKAQFQIIYMDSNNTYTIEYLYVRKC